MAEVFRNFLAGRQLANQERQQQNLLAQQSIENERQNRLMQMRETDFANAQQQFSQEQQLGAADLQRQSVARASAVARQALRLAGSDGAGEANARAFLRRSVPVYGKDFSAVADDFSDLTDDAIPWAQQMQNLQQIAAFGQEQTGDARSGFGNVNPGDFTPQSLAAYQRTIDPRSGIGDYSVLERIWAPPAVSVRDVGGAPSIVDPGNRLGDGPVRQLITPEEQRAADAAAAAATTGAQQDAKATAEARAGLGKAELQAQSAISTIDQLLSARGLPYITGAYSLAPIVPGTPQAAADALAKQIEGQAFLQAFESLKGAGQITEIEGQKATAAMARLQRAQSTKDYRAALQELKDIAARGLQRARAAANGTGGQQASPGRGGPAVGTVDGGYRFRGGDPADPNNWERAR